MADGSLNLTSPSASAGSNTWAGIWSSSPHDLTGSYAYVGTVDPGTAGDAGTEGQLRFALLTAQLYGITTGPPCNYLWITLDVTDGGLYYGWNTNTPGETISSYFGEVTSWSLAAYKYLRFREAGGVIYWENSADGITWDVINSVSIPFSITALYPALIADNYGTGSIAAQFANFNTVTGDGPDIYTPGGIAEATAVALSPDNAVVGSWSVRAGFDYGDSNEDVRQAVVAAVRSAASDSSLDIEFVAG